MQEEGLTSKGRHTPLLLYKQARDGGSIAELLHAYMNRATCEVGVFSRDYGITSHYYAQVNSRSQSI